MYFLRIRGRTTVSVFLKILPILTLADVVQWIKHWPVNQRVAGSFPSQGMWLGCRPGPHWGACERLPHIDFCLPLFLPHFSSIQKEINKISKKYRPLIHFELIFVYGVKQEITFILLRVDTQFSQLHLLEVYSFPSPSLSCLGTFVENSFIIKVQVFSGLSILFY